MKFIMVMLALSLGACATPNYYTKHGMGVFNKSVANEPSQKEMVETVSDWVAKKLGAPRQRLNKYKLIFIDKWLAFPTFDNTKVIFADGYTNPLDKVMIISVFRSCFADSSFVHELVHALTYDGTAPSLVRNIEHAYKDVVHSLEKEAIVKFCPEGYKHQECKVVDVSGKVECLD